MVDIYEIGSVVFVESVLYDENDWYFSIVDEGEGVWFVLFNLYFVVVIDGVLVLVEYVDWCYVFVVLSWKIVIEGEVWYIVVIFLGRLGIWFWGYYGICDCGFGMWDIFLGIVWGGKK